MRRLLYLNCILTDFAAFIVIFAVSRGLAEQHAAQWYLGVVGAMFSLSAAAASLGGGWLAHRFDSRATFLCGTVLMPLGIAACWLAETHWSGLLLPAYLLLGVGLGMFYPPLIGWLNQGEDVHQNRRGVSRTLILFCIAWNAGMMCGQLVAGSLFLRGPLWSFGASLLIALANVAVAVRVVLHVQQSRAVVESRPAVDPSHAQLANSFKRLGWIANLGGMFGGAMIVHLLPGLAVLIGVAPDDHGYMLGAWRMLIIATYLLLHFSTFWHFRFSVSLASQLVAAAGLIVIASAHSGTTLMIGLFLIGQLVGLNYFSGLYYSTVGSSDENRAFAAGVHEATLAVGMAVGTIAGGWLGSAVNQRAPYIFAAAMVVILAGIQIVAWTKWVRPLVAETHIAPEQSATVVAAVRSQGSS
jgi:MFS family permease